MKTAIIIFSLLIYTGADTSAQAQTSPGRHSPAGTWMINLGITPTNELYLQPFIIDDVCDNLFSGSIHGSGVRYGLVKTEGDQIVMAFKTRDQSNAYYHFAEIEGERMKGVTFSIDRLLLQPWTGIKN